MKIAILFFGVSKGEYYHFGSKSIDYLKSYDNYKKYLFDFFLKKGYEIDIYFTTNILDDEEKKKLCNTYNPIKCNFIQNESNGTISRNKKFCNVMELCMNTNEHYDLCLITRFDLLFQKYFNQSNIQLDKFNLVSILESPHLICDNFYLFPYKYMNNFYDIVKNNNHSFHNIKNAIEKCVGSKNMNYILNEHVCVGHLSFYKIVRN